jgi:hypothetical protein
MRLLRFAASVTPTYNVGVVDDSTQHRSIGVKLAGVRIHAHGTGLTDEVAVHGQLGSATSGATHTTP